MTSQATVHTFAAMAQLVRSRPARLGSVRVVAIDGPSGAGKSTFADRLSEAVRAAGHDAAVVRLDDFLDGWADPWSVWPRLRSCVLDPLAAGQPGEFRPYDWTLGRFADGVRVVPVPDVLILEGVTSARAEFRPRLCTSAFVRAPETVRIVRVLARDGAAIEPAFRTWQRAESAYFSEEATASHAEFIVAGAPKISIDAHSEFVVLPADPQPMTDATNSALMARLQTRCGPRFASMLTRLSSSRMLSRTLKGQSRHR